jgi:ADP-ribosyl-[dinitrogen reductase] hydrolase
MDAAEVQVPGPGPIPDSYWVRPGQLLAGEYPGSRDRDRARDRLARILGAGVTLFLDLTEEGEYGLVPYAPLLEELAGALGRNLDHRRMPIVDRSTPEPEEMVRILDAIDRALETGRVVYLHCYGGIGRTGTVAGCFLVRHGLSGHEALREIERLRQGTPDGWVTSPETPAQQEMVRSWPETQGIAGATPVRRSGAPARRSRLRGCAVGAATGDALGMPLEFGPPQSPDRLIRDMRPARLPPGTFTDDTEMALALADSLLARCPLDPEDLAWRFAAWLQAGPDDVGIHTRSVLGRIAAAQPWQEAVRHVQQARPDSAGNGSVMRCWPVALAQEDDLDQLLAGSRLQSRVTHPHPECEAGSAFVNATIYHLLRGVAPARAVALALDDARVPASLRAVVEAAPTRRHEALRNSGWVRHTLESAVWGLLTTDSFEEAVVQVVNLGGDADTAGAVVGALAGAAYGLEAIPARWQRALRGEWPLRSGTIWHVADLIDLADRLADATMHRTVRR